MRIIDPVAAKCVCENELDLNMAHFLLTGKGRYFKLVRDREWCIEKGLLQEIED